MTDVKLEPCPAGHKTVACREWPAHGPDKWHWFACCTCCGWQGPPGFRTEAEAIAAWNTRHQPQEREAVLEEAAKVAESSAKTWRSFAKMNLPSAPSPIINEDRAKTSEGIAEAIRALKTTPAPASEREAVLERYRHKARGTEYDLTGTAVLQDASGKGVEEGALLAVYRGDDGKLWARRYQEFGDGRFERVAALTTPAPAEREAVSVEEAAQRIFEHYEFGELPMGEKPAWVPNGNSEMQDVTRAFARAALKTTPAPAVEADQALLTDICDKMAEVVAPLPGIPDAPGQRAGTRAIEPSDGDKR